MTNLFERVLGYHHSVRTTEASSHEEQHSGGPFLQSQNYRASLHESETQLSLCVRKYRECRPAQRPKMQPPRFVPVHHLVVFISRSVGVRSPSFEPGTHLAGHGSSSSKSEDEMQGVAGDEVVFGGGLVISPVVGCSVSSSCPHGEVCAKELGKGRMGSWSYICLPPWIRRC